ncbi:unnamed protein product [Amoebophrya sp. A25]|nr:unnamed protein product [Amoebophrya sp. A25]|eukprot:GSA25T00005249001.1
MRHTIHFLNIKLNSWPQVVRCPTYPRHLEGRRFHSLVGSLLFLNLAL